MPYPIILYGGAYNPPHDGHEAVIRNLSRLAAKVLVVPSGHRIDKTYSSDSYQITNVVRRRVIEAFARRFETHPEIEFDYDMLEGKLERTTTVGMDEYYSRKYASPIAHAFGSDVVRDFPKWFDPETVRNRIQKILLVRDGDMPDVFGIRNYELLLPEMDKTTRGLSSSAIRSRLLLGDYSGLAPEVADVLREHRDTIIRQLPKNSFINSEYECSFQQRITRMGNVSREKSSHAQVPNVLESGRRKISHAPDGILCPSKR